MPPSLSTELIRLSYGEIYGRPAPVIGVTLFHNGARADVDAYVDSGASYSIFQSHVAELLGLDPTSGASATVFGLDGKRVKLNLHRVGLRIAGFQITANIGFSDQLAIGFNILGRDSIFDALQFCFNDRDGALTVSRLES